MNKSQILILHNSVPIEYREDKNDWTFELRGKERVVESLQKAREVIDQPAPKVKKPFTRVQAYQVSTYSSWNRDMFKLLEITSLAQDKDSSGRPYVWATNLTDKTREKVNQGVLATICPENDQLIVEIQKAVADIKALETHKEGLYKKFKLVDLKDPEAV